MTLPDSQALKELETLAKNDPAAAAGKYETILAAAGAAGSTDEAQRIQETAIVQLGGIYKALKRADDLANLITESYAFFGALPKAKSAKLVRSLIDGFAAIPETTALQVDVCKKTIAWAVQEKTVFLRQALETKLVALYLESRMYSDALALIGTLLRELKRLDDKNALMEVQLLESRVYHALRNLPKSRAALTSARTSANSIYCPPLMQAQLDMQSGILHAEEKDYKTAYSYFYETFEGFSSQDDPRAVLALKYMLLCKIMVNQAEDVHAIVSGKIALRYQGRDVEALRAVAMAHQHRSLQEFEQALTNYREELGNDPIIRGHLAALYDNLLEQNLTRIIEPFSKVEISHIAELVKLPAAQVETKLSQMILDKMLNGILDQGAGCLVIFDEVPSDKMYEASIDTIKTMNTVVSSLYEKSSTKLIG